MCNPADSHPAAVAAPLSAEAPRPPKLLDRLRLALQGAQVAPAQIAAYVNSVTGYIRFHGLRHPRELGLEHMSAFLAHLRRQPSSTPADEMTARAALGFLYDKFLPADTAAPAAGPPASRSPFLNRCHEILRLRHYALRSEECYVGWIKRFILFHGNRHPAELGTPEIEAFLTHLAVHDHVAASTQNQAFKHLGSTGTRIARCWHGNHHLRPPATGRRHRPGSGIAIGENWP